MFVQPRRLHFSIFPNFNKVTKDEVLLINEMIPGKLKINLTQDSRCIFYCLKIKHLKKPLQMDIKSLIMRTEHISRTENTQQENQYVKYKTKLWEIYSFRVRLKGRIQHWNQGGKSLAFTHICLEIKMRARRCYCKVFQEQTCAIFSLTEV